MKIGFKVSSKILNFSRDFTLSFLAISLPPMFMSPLGKRT